MSPMPVTVMTEAPTSAKALIDVHDRIGSAAAAGKPVNTSEIPPVVRMVESLTDPRSTDSEPAVSAEPFDPCGLVNELAAALGFLVVRGMMPARGNGEITSSLSVAVPPHAFILAATGVIIEPSVTPEVISAHVPAMRVNTLSPCAAAIGPLMYVWYA